MEMAFSDDQFQEAWRELDKPEMSGAWEQLTETMGVTIFRLYDKASGLYEYKVFGTLEDCPSELCIAVYMDLDYRKQWDQYVKELYETKDEDRNIIYWEVKYPFPLSNRDYVYVRELRELNIDGRKIWVILCKSTTSSQHPEKSGVIRVNDYKQSLAIESDGKSGCRVYLHCFDNPGGMIPSWLINWAAMTGVPSFLSDMQKACKSYPVKKTVSL